MSDQFRSMLTIPTRQPEAPAAAPTLADGRTMGITAVEPGGVLRSDGVTVEPGHAAEWKPSSQPALIYGGRNSIGGAPITHPSQIDRKTSVFEVAGIQMSVDNLLVAGLLREAPGGGYEVVEKQDGEEQQVEDAPADAEDFPTMTEDVAGAFDEISTALGSPERTNQLAYTTLSFLANNRGEDAVKHAARELGITVENARELTSGLVEDMMESAAAIITRENPDLRGYDVLQWASETMKPGQVAELAFALANGKRSAYAKLVADYRRGQFIAAAGAGRVAGFEK